MNFNYNYEPYHVSSNFFIESIYKEHFNNLLNAKISSDDFSYYNLKELDEKILSSFGVLKEDFSKKDYNLKSKKVILKEKVYIFQYCMIILKVKLHEDYEDFKELSDIVNEEKHLALLHCYFNNRHLNEVEKPFYEVISIGKEKPKRKAGEISILCNNANDGFSLKSIKTIPINIELENYYNDDFLDVSEHIINSLNTENGKGIVLLHGDPGTGKTSYLRHLSNVLIKTNKEIIYLPPDFAVGLSNPEIIEFFLDHTNSILIIEDAENILKSRELVGSNQSVANLLSLSDGLLGDGLKIQIICTFNSELSLIDRALTREGRLIAEYKFEKLSLEKTRNLIKKLYFPDENFDLLTINEKMTLAEIFNYKEVKYKTKKPQNSIGFNQNK